MTLGAADDPQGLVDRQSTIIDSVAGVVQRQNISFPS